MLDLVEMFSAFLSSIQLIRRFNLSLLLLLIVQYWVFFTVSIYIFCYLVIYAVNILMLILASFSWKKNTVKIKYKEKFSGWQDLIGLA